MVELVDENLKVQLREKARILRDIHIGNAYSLIYQKFGYSIPVPKEGGYAYSLRRFLEANDNSTFGRYGTRLINALSAMFSELTFQKIQNEKTVIKAPVASNSFFSRFKKAPQPTIITVPIKPTMRCIDVLKEEKIKIFNDYIRPALTQFERERTKLMFKHTLKLNEHEYSEPMIIQSEAIRTAIDFVIQYRDSESTSSLKDFGRGVTLEGNPLDQDNLNPKTIETMINAFASHRGRVNEAAATFIKRGSGGIAISSIAVDVLAEKILHLTGKSSCQYHVQPMSVAHTTWHHKNGNFYATTIAKVAGFSLLNKLTGENACYAINPETYQLSKFTNEEYSDLQQRLSDFQKQQASEAEKNEPLWIATAKSTLSLDTSIPNAPAIPVLSTLNCTTCRSWHVVPKKLFNQRPHNFSRFESDHVRRSPANSRQSSENSSSSSSLSSTIPIGTDKDGWPIFSEAAKQQWEITTKKRSKLRGVIGLLHQDWRLNCPQKSIDESSEEEQSPSTNVSSPASGMSTSS